MSDEASFLALFALDTRLSITTISNNGGTEVLGGPLKAVNAWGITLELGTRPKPVFYPWHCVLKVEHG